MKQLNIRLRDEDMERLESVARERRKRDGENVLAAWLAREAVEEWLERQVAG